MINTNKIEFICKEEKKYHNASYENYIFFEVGSRLSGWEVLNKIPNH